MKSNRPHRIMFEQRRRPSPANPDSEPILDEYGDEVEQWESVFEEYAAVYFGSGTEQRAAAQTEGEQAASFEVLSNNRTRSLTVSDYRISYQGGKWDIRSIADIGFNDGMKINAVRAKP